MDGGRGGGNLMKLFADLFDTLEQTKSTKEKIALIKNYFLAASPKDAAWAIFFLCGNRLKRLITGRMLYEWCMDYLKMPEWLMLEAYSAVGDVAETIALLLQNHAHERPPSQLSLADWIEGRILPLQGKSQDFLKEAIISYWNELSTKEIFLLNKIMAGSLRIGTSQLLATQGLSLAIGVSREKLTLKLMGSWEPSVEFYESLKEAEPSSLAMNPYPFYLASPLDRDLEELGEVKEWDAEWKWDGIRAQAIIRNGKVAIWSRGNELVTEQFPEVAAALSNLSSGTVLDGEILAYQDGLPLPYGELQKRLGRKKITNAHLKNIPIVFMIYDILEYCGQDIRSDMFEKRREILDRLKDYNPKIMISPRIEFSNWQELKVKREEAKINRTEGIILKKKQSKYGTGRRRGSWWKYKIDPKTIDTVLLYAQPGQGWRANVYTDYTFGIWHGTELVPIAKAYSGLNNEEIKELDQWIRKNTIEKYGPVRKVKSEQVFEIAFEGIQESKRHKAGVALRFPRIFRWRKDKMPSECDSIDSVRKEFLNF